MKEKTRVKLKKVRLFYALFRVRFDRGFGLIGQVVEMMKLSAFATILVTAWNSAAGHIFEIPLVWIPYSVVIIIPILYLLGYFDQKKIHLVQLERGYAMKHMNAFWDMLDKRLKRIEDKLTKL